MATKHIITRTIYTGTALLLMLLAACEDFVVVDQPASQLTSMAVFNDKATANAALSSIYSRLRDAGMLTGGRFGISTNMGVYADELEYYGDAYNPTRNFYLNALTPPNNEVLGWWSSAYNQVYASNAVIEGLAASTGISQGDKDIFTGEALFLRALYHFYLVNLYGEVPYITTTDYQSNSTVSRLPSEQVYTMIISDLQLAVSLLPQQYIYPERIRPNKAVATALLARVYLYHGNWAEAAESASYLINNDAEYAWTNDLSTVFLKEASTTIWQLAPEMPGQNTAEGQNFIFEGGPPNHTALSGSLLAAFEPGDLREELWTGQVTEGENTWYYANKYKERETTPASVEYSIQLRMSEQYLIRAEARARQGDLIGSAEDLDKVRNAAGLPGTPAVTADALIDAILRERHVELFTEGHRFFDLKRTARLDSELQGEKPGWNTTDRLLPLPESELLKNANLSPQNPGY